MFVIRKFGYISTIHGVTLHLQRLSGSHVHVWYLALQ